ncbi:MAG: hypothetical protein H6742_22280 [Alphaproteobacteria bacterium]|nr:hypothetical protein [Alphaproteobacteria bacterium]
MSSSPAPETLLAALLLLPGVAFAQGEEASAPEPPTTAAEPGTPVELPSPAVEEEPPPDAMPGEAGETLVIYDQAEVARRRKALEQQIRELDYRVGKDKGDRTIFRPEVPWKPSVIVHDDGRVDTRRSPVRWRAPGREDNPLNQLWCLPPFTPMCVRIGGQVVSKAKLQPRKQDVLDAIDPARDAWVEAIAGQATWARVNEQVPTLVDAVWQQGATMDGREIHLADPAARRGELLSFWASRADTPEGEMVAQVVADFLQEVVQSSPHPVTREELDAANARAEGGRRLDLTVPGTPLPKPALPQDPGPVELPAPAPPPGDEPG